MIIIKVQQDDSDEDSNDSDDDNDSDFTDCSSTYDDGKGGTERVVTKSWNLLLQGTIDLMTCWIM